jgi:Co/Zn/Cd efflux system component
MIAGQLAGSQALKADALDFLADTVTYGLSLAVIGASLRTRATAALAKGVSLSLMALWVFGSTVYQAFILGLPKAEVMGVVGRAGAGGKPCVGAAAAALYQDSVIRTGRPSRAFRWT